MTWRAQSRSVTVLPQSSEPKIESIAPVLRICDRTEIAQSVHKTVRSRVCGLR